MIVEIVDYAQMYMLRITMMNRVNQALYSKR
jgi:hypothetical protein